MILHHFDASPFSEKIRLILGYKGAAWQGVRVPRILPKPDLMPLTGGYRRTPVLQIGRDVYADTRLIARELERRLPEPTLYPPGQAASIAALEALGDQRLFRAAIPLLLSPAGQTALIENLGEAGLAAFRADRAALFDNGRQGPPTADDSHGVWHPTMRALDAQLAERPFLLGDTPCLADFSVYHPVWYVRNNPGVADELSHYRHLLAWADRMAGLGHGRLESIDGPAALDTAAATPGFVPLAGGPVSEASFAEDATVAVSATDYGSDRVYGRLVVFDDVRIVIERDTDSLGTLRNHFPRAGFCVEATDAQGRPETASDTVY